MSTSSISSAPSRTSSGRRSLTGAPVIVATASATLSRCWTFIVLTTWMPASRMTSTSCQRFVAGRARARSCGPARRSSATVGLARDDRVGVHLLDDDAAVLDPPARHDLEAVEQLGGVRPAVGLDEADDEVRAARRPAGGPPRASGRSCRRPGAMPEVDAQAAARRSPASAWTRASISSAVGPDVERVALGVDQVTRQQAVEVEVEQQDVDARLAEEAEERLLGVAGDAARTSSSVMPRAAATRATWYSAAAGLMCGSSPDAEVVTRSTGIGASPLRGPEPLDVGRDPVDERLFVGPRFEPAEAFAS